MTHPIVFPASYSFLRNVLARVVFIREECDTLGSAIALEDLEHDIANELNRLRLDPTTRVCLDDFNDIPLDR